MLSGALLVAAAEVSPALGRALADALSASETDSPRSWTQMRKAGTGGLRITGHVVAGEGRSRPKRAIPWGSMSAEGSVRSCGAYPTRRTSITRRSEKSSGSSGIRVQPSALVRAPRSVPRTRTAAPSTGRPCSASTSTSTSARAGRPGTTVMARVSRGTSCCTEPGVAPTLCAGAAETLAPALGVQAAAHVTVIARTRLDDESNEPVVRGGSITWRRGRLTPVFSCRGLYLLSPR